MDTTNKTTCYGSDCTHCVQILEYSDDRLKYLNDLTQCLWHVDMGVVFNWALFLSMDEYLNYEWTDVEKETVVPCEILPINCMGDRVCYLRKTMQEITCQRLEKPEWMHIVEENANVNGYYPSTFIHLCVKEDNPVGAPACLDTALYNLMYGTHPIPVIISDKPC